MSRKFGLLISGGFCVVITLQPTAHGFEIGEPLSSPAIRYLTPINKLGR
jgi:hypothetical protein